MKVSIDKRVAPLSFWFDLVSTNDVYGFSLFSDDVVNENK